MYTLLGLAIFYYALVACFVAIMHAKYLRATGVKLSLFWKASLAPLGVLGLVLDVIFNLTIGTLMYLEVPQIAHLTFTARCHKHKAELTWRGKVARWWCAQLDQIDPGHC